MRPQSIALICRGWLAALPLALALPALAAPEIDSQVLSNAAAGPTDFIVVLSQQADLSGAASLKTKEAKGRFVYTQLTATAAASQAPLVALLKARQIEHQPFWVANMIRVRGDLTAIEALAARPETARIVANPHLQMPPPITQSAARELLASIEPNLVKVNAPQVWALGFTGQGVVVGGQDTGYEWTHPALQHHYRGWSATAVDHNYNWHDAIHQKDVQNSTENPLGYNLTAPADDNFHGTHTMGIVVGDDGAGNQIGMAPGARWIGCRNMDRGAGTPATYSECFQWLIAPTDLSGNNPDPSKAPDVINDSWLCPPAEGCTDPWMLQTLVQNVRAAGIVVVASAGNSGPNCSTITWPPALYDASFSVGATDNSDAIAYFSSRGPVVSGSNTLVKPNVSAPGVVVRSSTLNGQYATASGTSMAGPHVAGLVALLISAHPELRGQVDGIERIIEHTAVPLTSTQDCGGIPGSQVPNAVFGWGRVNALAALGLGDSDGDGIPDWWEWWHDLNPNDASDALLDADGDGVSNRDEYLAGTDPRDAASYFHIESAQANPQPAIQFQSLTNRLYTLSASAKVSSGVWSDVPEQIDIPGNGGLLTLADTSPPDASPRFYRVKVRIR